MTGMNVGVDEKAARGAVSGMQWVASVMED
jgi:hypothetical protein